jgi:hypothetical protein
MSTLETHIPAEDITAVVLADGRHEVEVGSFVVIDTAVLGGIAGDGPWFSANAGRSQTIAGPLSSVLAVVLGKARTTKEGTGSRPA